MFKFGFIPLLLVIASACPTQLCSCSGQACSFCLASFAYMAGSTCVPCPIQCKTCSTASVCLTCQPNYYLSNNSCLLCPLNCKVCSPSCTQCIDGYALNQNICSPCADSNALTCRTPTKVLTCKQGYWQNGNSCSPCRQFCLFCTSSSNCFQCQSGYEVAVSFGSYCTSCPLGCRTCSSNICSECFYNYMLLNGACKSITNNCTQISYCSLCSYLNQTVVCHSCTYPYYLVNSTCVKGSSLLCQNGATGPMYYQCLDSCGNLGYKADTFNNRIICQPNTWINSNYHLYLNPFSLLFLGYAKQKDVQWTVVSDSHNQISFTMQMTPYYKLQFFFKILAFNSYNTTINYAYTLKDNNSNSQVRPFSPQMGNYEAIYDNFTTKILQQQTVTVTISTPMNLSFGLAQVLVQIYSCPNNCRLCYNKQLCFQCLSAYFNTPDYSCVTSCPGYIQLYLPAGDSNNYTSKSCVLECPSTFYLSHNATSYRCHKCVGTCITCLSEIECLSCIAPFLYYQINYTCLQTCPSTHFSSNSICTPCIAPCETCLDRYTCLSCSVGFLNGVKCSSSCPLGTFQNRLNNTCSSCNSRCSSCLGSSSYCLECNHPFLLQESSCVSNCTTGLYYQKGNLCSPCVVPCRQCITQTECLSCSVGYLYQTQCLSECRDRFYADKFKGTCIACSNGCLTCLSSTVCLSCPNPTNLYSYSCYENCPINTYPALNICLNCLLPCDSCVNQSYCVSCSIGYLSQVLLGQCVSKCEQKYYGFDLNRTCLSCTNNCSTCSVASYLCLSCPPDLVLQNSACVSSCEAGLFNLSGSCYPCTYPCLTCANYDYFCISCINSYILINNTCQIQCPNNHYLNVNTCLACLSPCQACSSATECLSCVVDPQNQTFLYDKTCVPKCPSLTFADSSSLTCRVCIYPCLSCLSEERCLSCAFGYLDRENGVCSICPSNMYANESSRQCERCSSIANCQTCQSSYQCIQCNSGYYLYNSTCIGSEKCLSFQNYYPNDIYGICSKCISPCKTCLNQSYCTSCTSGFLLNGGCLAYCPSNHYELESICYQCQFPCLTCKNSTACLSCNATSPFDTLFVANSSCMQSWLCGYGYYIDNSSSKICTKCKLPCLTCTNSTNCLSCFSGILINGNCRSLCPSMYYANNSNPNLTFCSQCSSNCFKCAKYADYCTSCRANQYLRNNTCVNSCGSGYYLDQAVLQCFKCLSPCGNCSSISECLDCDNKSYTLYYGQCLSSCPDGSYSNQSSCLPCPSSCLTCSISTSNKVVCKSCNFGLFMSSKAQGQCLSNCSMTEYGDIITRNCYQCIDPCSSCSSAILCLSCKHSYLLYQSQCLRITRCPALSYLLNRSCIDNCGGLWADASTAACQTNCLPPSLKIQQNQSKICVSQCRANYRVDKNYTCLSCKEGGCSNLLSLQMSYKNIFNVLYLKMSFNRVISTGNLRQNMTVIGLQSTHRSRLLTDSNITFAISRRNLDAIWIEMQINQSLKNADLSIVFSDYYIFQQPLQKLNYNLIIQSFDYYEPHQKTNAPSFQKIGEVMSIIMILLFLLNLAFNSGHLSYSIIDYYQLLFMVLFLSIDFTPQLNHFLYGFRYSHFLFLPQIFRADSESSLSTATPNQFGAIVPDVSFINNTGQDFVIIFSTIGLLIICKLMQMCFSRFECFRSNKVRSEGEQQEKEQRWCVVVVQAIIRRFKWNYFNDIIYSIYFSIVLFAFSQLYDLQWKNSPSNLISILLAFIFLALGIILPFFLIWFLSKNEANLIENSLLREKESYLTKKKLALSIKQTVEKDKQLSNNRQKQGQDESQEQKSKIGEQQGKSKYQILTDYKCFLSGIKLRVRLGFYHVPIRYMKKLIFAAILTYCSQYPSFVIGVIIMLSFINILITLVLRPYRLTFEHILYPIFDFLFILIFFIACVIQLPFLDLTKADKLTASYAFIAICTLLSLLLAVHSIVVNCVQIIKYFYKVDYFSKYYQTQYISSSDESEHFTEQGTNTPMKKDNIEEQPPFTGSQIFSGLDIYLKKQSNAPHYLIKCVKQDQQVEKQQQSQQAKHQMKQSGLRESSQGILQVQTNKRISQSKRQEISKMVQQIQTINFEEEEQSND